MCVCALWARVHARVQYDDKEDDIIKVSKPFTQLFPSGCYFFCRRWFSSERVFIRTDKTRKRAVFLFDGPHCFWMLLKSFLYAAIFRHLLRSRDRREVRAHHSFCSTISITFSAFYSIVNVKVIRMHTGHRRVVRNAIFFFFLKTSSSFVK